MSNHVKRFLILGVLVGVLVIGCVISLMMRPSKDSQKMIEISVDGEVVGMYSFEEDGTIRIGGETDYNIVVIKDQTVYVEEADCSGQDCVHMTALKNDDTIQTPIACLPHGVVVDVVESTIQK